MWNSTVKVSIYSPNGDQSILGERSPFQREKWHKAINVMNLNGPLFRAQTSLDMILCDLSEHMETFGVVERLRSLLLSLKGLPSEQWGSLHSEVVPNIFHSYTAASWIALSSNLLLLYNKLVLPNGSHFRPRVTPFSAVIW